MPIKGGGGNSHQRAIERARAGQPVRASAAVRTDATPRKSSWGLRLLLFIEQPLVTTGIAILAGLVDIVSHVPVLMLCGVLFLIGLHRAGAVAGKPIWRVQVPAYVAVLIVVSSGLYEVHVLLEKSTSQFMDQLVGRIVSGVSKSAPAAPLTLPLSAPASAQVIETRVSSEHEIIANGVPTGNTILLIPGQPVALNVWFANNGTATADHAKGEGGIYLTGDRSEATEETITAHFRQKIRDSKSGEGAIQAGGREEFWFTTKSNRAITEDDVQRINSGEEFVYFLVSLTWSDPSGDHYIHRCRQLQPLHGDPKTIWQFCRDFADHH